MSERIWNPTSGRKVSVRSPIGLVLKSWHSKHPRDFVEPSKLPKKLSPLIEKLRKVATGDRINVVLLKEGARPEIALHHWGDGHDYWVRSLVDNIDDIDHNASNPSTLNELRRFFPLPKTIKGRVAETQLKTITRQITKWTKQGLVDWPLKYDDSDRDGHVDLGKMVGMILAKGEGFRDVTHLI
jgi:hypothetical protein